MLQRAKMPEKKLFLGIDTSNYTTSIALCDFDGRVVLNLKKLLAVSEGERGLRQSDALFAHTKNIPELSARLGEFLCAMPEAGILAVGYSATPRDAEDSYMPCFLAGVSAASAVSAALSCKSYGFSHQGGHIMAALYSAGKTELLQADEPFAAFHVSGGTTDLLLVKPQGRGFDILQIGGSNDINAGQAIDRTGVLMGMRFPCGREMESLLGEREIGKIKTKISVSGLNCNLSGLENLAGKVYLESGDKAYTSAYCFDFVGDTLCKMTENLRAQYPDIPIIYAGGVMSNKRIGSRLAKYKDTYFSEPEFSSDNAAGVALLCRKRYLEENN